MLDIDRDQSMNHYLLFEQLKQRTCNTFVSYSISNFFNKETTKEDQSKWKGGNYPLFIILSLSRLL